MTRLVVTSGICGFKTRVTASSAGDKKVHITLESDCEMIQCLNDELGPLNVMDAFTGFLNNPVYKTSAKCLRHVACPVPSGILKALEVEAGFCLPKDVEIKFEGGPDD